MIQMGYAVSSEEHRPRDLVRYARRAEECGFEFAFVSDHFHPWIDKQGQSAFVWGVLGAMAEATEQMTFATGVTCPIIRIHPAIIAQASATAAALMPGRFMLGVGTGEALNEHILGTHWPEAAVRMEMLEEAVDVIRLLWKGRTSSHRGRHFTVSNARIYSLPPEPPPILVAASGRKAAQLAGRIGDGLVATSSQRSTVEAFEEAGGAGKPKYGQYSCCWAPNADEAKRTAHEWWPTSAMPGQLSQELALPAFFEQAAKLVTPEQVASDVVCGPDPQPHFEKIREFAEAGFTHLYVHQVGPDQEGFFRFYEREVLPHLRAQQPLSSTA